MRIDEAARTYLGAPFLHQGRNPAVGIDCIGLIVCAARDCGFAVDEHDDPSYGTDPHDGLLESHLAAAFDALPVGDMAPGDIVAINFKGAIRHVGVIGRTNDGRLSLIHTNFDLKQVTEAGIDARWLRRIKRVYRVRA